MGFSKARCKLCLLWMSLVASVVTGLLIARNCVVRDEYQIGFRHTSMQVASGEGVIGVNVETHLVYVPVAGIKHKAILPMDASIGYWYEPELLMTSSGQVFVNWNSCDFRLTYGRSRRGTSDVCVQCPLWFLEALFLIAPACWLIQRVNRKGIIPAARPCPNCGYDTIGNLSRCSECGHPCDQPAEESANPSPAALGAESSGSAGT